MNSACDRDLGYFLADFLSSAAGKYGNMHLQSDCRDHDISLENKMYQYSHDDRWSPTPRCENARIEDRNLSFLYLTSIPPLANTVPFYPTQSNSSLWVVGKYQTGRPTAVFQYSPKGVNPGKIAHFPVKIEYKVLTSLNLD